MNGAEHYVEAERLIARANGIDPALRAEAATATIGLAQVHATLALAAATIDSPQITDGSLSDTYVDKWNEATS